MATAGSIVVDLLVRTGSFETDMDRAARTSRRAGREMKRSAEETGAAWKRAASMLGTFFAGLRLASGLNAFIQNTIRAQDEQAQLAAVLKSTGHAAGLNAGELNKMALAMQRVTAFSSDDVTQAQTTLLAFTGIAGKEFPRAMQAAADMAARTGMTIKAAAETIGRALDVPSQGLSSLSRQGFRFTDEQKELAKQLEATGRTAEAQAIVLGALEESYGGAAVAARDTLGGALAALKNTVSALLTDESGSLGLLRSGIEGINDVLGSDAARIGLETLAVGAGAVAVALGVKLAAGALSAIGSFVALQASTVRYQYTLAKMAGVSVTAAAGLSGLGLAARAASTALAFVGGPVGAVVLALGGAAWAWNRYGHDAREQASAGAPELDATRLGVDELAASLRNLTEAQIAARRMKAEEKLEKLQATAIEAAQALRSVERDYAALEEMFRAGRGVNAEGLKNVEKTLIELRDAFDGANQDVDQALVALAKLDEAARTAAGGVAPLVDELDRYRLAYQKFLKDFATPDERFKAAVAEHRELLGPLFDDDALARLRSRYLPKSPEVREQSGDLQNLVKRLEEQRATLGMTTEAAERYRIEQSQGTAAHRARALALHDEIQAWQAAQHAAEAAAHAQARQIEQAAESARHLAAVQNELSVFADGLNIDIAGVGMGERQREQMQREHAIREDFAQRRRALEEAQQIESTRLTQAHYEARLNGLQEAESQQIELLRLSAQAKLEAEGDWINGLTRGVQNYADGIANVAQVVEGAVIRAFGGMESALVDFAATGKMNFKSLADSIIKDMIRIAIQQSVTGPLARAFGGWLGGVGGAAGGATAAGTATASAAMLRLSSGGYTGDGGRFEPAGIVHRGEGVLNQDEIRAIGGEAGFNALRRAIRGPGHAVGGMAGRPALPPMANPASSGPVNVTVNVSGNSGAAQVDAPSGWQQFAKEIGTFVEAKFRELEVRSHRPGGTAWQIRQRAYA